MTLVYRGIKKTPLTIEELDGNFKELENRIKELEKTPGSAEGIGKITQSGDELLIIGTWGTVLGRCLLPKCIPRPRGLWQPHEVYTLGDWVAQKQILYACVQPHRSSLDFETDAAYWQFVINVQVT